MFLAEEPVSAAVASQLKRQLADQVAPGNPRKKQKSPSKPTESAGEASARIALIHAFGDWFRGGEVVQEFLPFTTHEYRADFALPRYKIYVEVDGWQHHGKSLTAHHSDRERGLWFSRHDWLPFRVSHQQAKCHTTYLVEAISQAMSYRKRLDLDASQVERYRVPSGYRTRYVAQ